MTSKEYIFSQIRQKGTKSYQMPETGQLAPVTYPDVLKQFMETVELVGGHAVLLEDDNDINRLIKELYPHARVLASSIQGIDVTINPDEVALAQELNGIDVGVVLGTVAVAENGCVWVPQTMSERAVMFISENLIIIINKEDIVNNMHEAYSKIEMSDYGYGCFISGPSKTADIAQALVMGAQAARGVTVIVKSFV